MNKKGQGGSSEIILQLAKLVIAVLIFIVLFTLLFRLIDALTSKKPLQNVDKDFERIIGEIKSLGEGETLKVPVLSYGYSLVVISKRVADSENIHCVGKGNYCACIIKNNNFRRCDALELSDSSKEYSVQIDQAGVNMKDYVTLSREGNTISIR